MFNKYRWNFVMVVLLVAIIGFIIFDFIFYFNIKGFLFEETFNEMETKTHLAQELIESRQLLPTPTDQGELYELTYQLRSIVNSRVSIIDSSGRVITDSDVARDKVVEMDNHLHRPEVQDAIKHGWGQSYRHSDTVKRNLFYTAFKWVYQGQVVGFIRLSYYAQRFEESMDQIINLLIGSTLIGLVILILISLLTGVFVTNPILHIVKTAQKISSGELDETFHVTRRDEVGHLATILNELTDRLKNQIKEISNERTKLEHILTHLDIGVIVIDKNKNVLHANPVAFHILERKYNKPENLNVVEIIRNELLLEAIKGTLQDNDTNNGEFILYSESVKKFVRFMVTPYALKNGKQLGALIQLQDITELKRLEAIRKDFVANASHELKTPLTSIIGYADTLLEGASIDNISQKKFIRKIREQGQRLEFLISDLLMLSELEREHPLELEVASLNKLIEEIIEDFATRAAEKQITISFANQREVKAKVDAEAIRTVFNNLIDNAIKYTQKNGKIEIRLLEDTDNKVKVEVIDDGIGIDPKYHERIFQRFHRIDKARSRALGGTGLGLSIVKHIIERHGSQINIDSKLNQGSRFYFVLRRI